MASPGGIDAVADRVAELLQPVGTPPAPYADLGCAQPGVRRIDGPPEFRGALPIDLKDLAHRRLEVVETRTLAARGDQLGVGADRQAERMVFCF